MCSHRFCARSSPKLSWLQRSWTTAYRWTHTGYTENKTITAFLLNSRTRIIKNNAYPPVLQSKSSLEVMESQSCDAEPPPPPKPELRYPGITRGNMEGKPLGLPIRAPPSVQHLKFFVPPPLCRVQPAEKSPSHSDYVQIQTQLQPRREPYGSHSCLCQPGKADERAALMMAFVPHELKSVSF